MDKQVGFTSDVCGSASANPLARFATHIDAVETGRAIGVGSAILVEPPKAVAGAYVECRFRFTVGTGGIAKGGRVRIAMRHVCQWTPPQTTEPTAPGFSTTSIASGAGLSIEGWDKIADSADLFAVMFPWQHVIDITMTEHGLSPCEVIEFVYGDQSKGSPGVRAQRFSEAGFAFRVFVDHDGSGSFLPTADDVLLPIVSGEMSRLVLVTPSNAETGTPTRLLIRAEDRFGNLARHYIETIVAFVADGPYQQRIELQLEEGLCSRDDIVFLYPGDRTFRVDEVHSNPVRVRVSPPEPFTLWGELHGHTLLSDGRGTVDEYYDYARLVSGLDVCAVTDHDFMLSDESWAASKSVTNSHNQPGRFVTLQAFEWSGQHEVGGDRNVYFAEDDPPIIRSRSYFDYRNTHNYHGFAAQANHVEDLFNWLSEHCTLGSVFVAAHFGGRPANKQFHRPELERLIEIFSEHRRSENWAYTFRSERQLGIIAGGDDHIGRPGNGFLAYSDKGKEQSFGLGLVGIQAKEFTREGVFRALYHKQVYATTGARILLNVTVNGFPMGSDDVVCNGPPVINIDVNGTAELGVVQIVRDMKIVHEVYPEGTCQFDEDAYCASNPDVADAVLTSRIPSGHFHYATNGMREGRQGPMRQLSALGRKDLKLIWQDTSLNQTGKLAYHVRVVQVDGHIAISSPIECDVRKVARAPYDRDGLRSVHNNDFMDDQQFLKAYNRGVRAVGRDYNWQWRVHVGLWAARTAAQVTGDFVEFGTNRGFMSSAIMEDLDWDSTGKRFYLLDTFSGLDERFVTEEERRSGILEKNQSEIEKGFYATSVEPVVKNFSSWKNVTIIPGPVPITLDRLGQGPFAFVHIDMNCAPPEIAALKHVWDSLTPGALILLDDYAYMGYEPQKLAIDALGGELGFEVLSLPTGQGLIVKSSRPGKSINTATAPNSPEKQPVELPNLQPNTTRSPSASMPSAYYDAQAMSAVVNEKNDHRMIIGGLWDELGSLQLDYLCSQGMKPEHRLLDIGCGSLRLGVKAANYLNAGNYVGTDLNESFLDVGYREEILPAGLETKLPRSNLVVDGEFTFHGLPKNIDFAIAQSVFTHLPLNHLRLCLARLADHLIGPCDFLFTVFLAPEGREAEAVEQYPGIITHPHKDPYHYRVADIQNAASGLPWDIEFIGAWGHPRNQMMVRTRLNKQPQQPTVIKPTTRQLPAQEARNLSPGAEHYAAYVGPPREWDFMGATQFRLLAALGIREHHKLLDIGCGSLRAGRLLIAYLSQGNYYGIEPNTWLIDEAIEKELGRDLVKLKQPNFSASSKFDAESFGVKFDFIVAQSIFSHAGPELVHDAFEQIGKTLSRDGLALVTFIHPDQIPGVPIEAPGWTYPGCTTYEPARIMELISAADLAGRRLPWYHPRQTWYVLAVDPSKLPSPDWDRHLSGAVLRDPDFEASV